MADKKNYEARTEELLSPIAEANGVWIYDVEYVKEGSDWYLRAYIEKDGGVTINDCENVSRALSDMLDKEDFIADNYILEVSSPGLGRQLKKDRHFENSIGMDVEVKLYESLNGQKEYAGQLKCYDKDSITIILGEEDNGDDNNENNYENNNEEITLVRKSIASVKLALDF